MNKIFGIRYIVGLALFSPVMAQAATSMSCSLGAIEDFSQAISVKDTSGPINEIPGSVLENIGGHVDWDTQGFLHSRSFDLSNYTPLQLNPFPDEPSRQLQGQEINDYIDLIYKYREEEKPMHAGIGGMELSQLKPELTYVKTEVFSEFVHFDDPTSEQDEFGKWNDDYIPVATYKFWGYLVPPETGTYHFRITSDDGVVVHMNMNTGNGLEEIIDDFNFHAPRTVEARWDNNSKGNFELTGGEGYAIHIQWFNKDGRQQLELEYHTDGSDWQQIPASWFYSSDGRRGIQSIELASDAANLDLNLGGFTEGDTDADVTVSLLNQTGVGTGTLLVHDFFGGTAECAIDLTGDAEPVAAATVSSKDNPSIPGVQITVIPNEEVEFSAAGSTDDGELTYSWSLADGTVLAAGEIISYQFTETGNYSVTLTVTDALGQTDTAEVNVVVVIQDMVDDEAPSCSTTIDSALLTGTASDHSDANEDLDHNGRFNDGEFDRNGNYKIDYDSGIASIELINNLNLGLTITSQDKFDAQFTIEHLDRSSNASGLLAITDAAGNKCAVNVVFAAIEPLVTEVEIVAITSPSGKDITAAAYYPEGSTITVTGGLEGEDEDEDTVKEYRWQLRDEADGIYLEYRISKSGDVAVYHYGKLVDDSDDYVNKYQINSYKTVTMPIDFEGEFSVALVVVDVLDHISADGELSETAPNKATNAYAETGGGLGVTAFALVTGVLLWRRK